MGACCSADKMKELGGKGAAKMGMDLPQQNTPWVEVFTPKGGHPSEVTLNLEFKFPKDVVGTGTDENKTQYNVKGTYIIPQKAVKFEKIYEDGNKIEYDGKVEKPAENIFIVKGEYKGKKGEGQFELTNDTNKFLATGYYEQHGSRHNMEIASLLLSGTHLVGSGKDDTGSFTVSGSVNETANTVTFVKTYPSHTVDYQRSFTRVGTGFKLAGNWSIGGASGAFEIERK